MDSNGEIERPHVLQADGDSPAERIRLDYDLIP
jgi:hypothetical protein